MPLGISMDGGEWYVVVVVVVVVVVSGE